jgi:hypothetical protein
LSPASALSTTRRAAEKIDDTRRHCQDETFYDIAISTTEFSLTAWQARIYPGAAVRPRLFLLAGLTSILMTGASALAQAPLPILRGIVLTANGEGRAYFEDPSTGTLGAYLPRDTVGDSQIEEIRDDRVVLRRGRDLVHVLLGGPSPALASEGTDPGSPPPSMDSATPVSPPVPVIQPARTPSTDPIIGNGQPWLERLGIPPRALSRAIEQALPAQDSDNLEE